MIMQLLQGVQFSKIVILLTTSFPIINIFVFYSATDTTITGGSGFQYSWES